SHLTGRFRIQFGPRFGDAVSVAVSAMPPGGLLANVSQSPLAQAFKHRIPTGQIGHNELLRFPKSTYHMEGVAFLDDPLDLVLRAINLKTGMVLHHRRRRGLINPNWLLAMIGFEEHIPKATFEFRGDASFEKGGQGQTVFKYVSDLKLPFPAGLKFPMPDLK